MNIILKFHCNCARQSSCRGPSRTRPRPVGRRRAGSPPTWRTSRGSRSGSPASAAPADASSSASRVQTAPDPSCPRPETTYNIEEMLMFEWLRKSGLLRSSLPVPERGKIPSRLRSSSERRRSSCRRRSSPLAEIKFLSRHHDEVVPVKI